MTTDPVASPDEWSGTPVLGALVAPLSAGDFLDLHFPSRWCVMYGDPARLAGLADALELSSLEEVLACPSQRILAMRVGRQRDFARVVVTSAEAATRYRAHDTIYVHGLRPRSVGLRRWLGQLADDLGLPPQGVRCNVFVSRRGPGAPAHFDGTEGFAVQVRGAKRWRVAPNQTVAFPPIGHVAGQSPAPALAAVCPQQLPRRMPAGAEVVDAQPGTVLFLPRGTWHATRTLEDSLHVDLALDVPTRLRLLVRAVHRRLLADPRWRAPAVFPSGARGAAAEAELEELLRELDAHLGMRTAADVLRPATDR